MSARLRTGQVLEDKYTIVRQIGGGGMGIVYEAEHMALNVRVAIKVLHPTESDDPNVLARFKSEARSAAGIRHRNVVDVTDYGLTPDRRPFFVMEFLTGESLADRLDKRKALTEREAVEITDQILSGLGAAHKKGIIHRDMKPENVWLAKGEDGSETVKLLDFGIAKIVGGSRTSRNLATVEVEARPTTQTGMVLGTPGYMAPEAITVGGGSDARSDLFAVGVLLYEMIVGRRPFNGVTVHEIMMATATDPVPQPSVVNPEISPAMERLVLTALAKEPSDRFQSTDEFLRHLTAAAVGRIPDNARPCVTRVCLPSVIPPAALKRVKVALPDPKTDLSNSRSGDLLRRSGTAGGRYDPALKQSATAGPRPELRRSRELSRSGVDRGALSKTASLRGSRSQRRVRFSLPISPLAILFLVGLGAAFYFLYLRDGPWREIGHEESWKLNGRAPAQASPENVAAARPDGAESAPPKDAAAGGTVTIWLDIDPFEAHVTLNGSPIAERPITVPRGDAPIQLRATAPGREPLSVDVVPDRDRTVRLRLRPN